MVSDGNFMNLPFVIKPYSLFSGGMRLGVDLDKTNIVEICTTLDDWNSVDKLLHNYMIMSA
jgi:hypothetical protein